MIRNKKRAGRFVSAVLAAVMLLGGCGNGDRVDTAPGIGYLESLEQQDPAAVDQILRQRRMEELEVQREELLRQIKADELDPFAVFQDAVILGDSRAVGFFYYGFVDESRDLTGSGDTILNIPDKLDQLEAMNPRYIYLTYGLNDIKIGHWATLEDHIESYMARVREIQERLPDAVIIISSVLPFRDPSAQPEPGGDGTETVPTASSSSSGLSAADKQRLTQIPRWNKLMEETCREFGLIFVDNSAICEEFKNLWEPDGIHVMKSFYPKWGKNLAVAALEEGGIVYEEASA